MQKETFINQMEARGYETTTLPNGNVKAKRGDIILRLVPLANYSVHISTPTVNALTANHATDQEILHAIDALTVQP
ncbi:hypothetical protein BP677P8_00043 [Bifidobacterium phage BP677P8]|nr:hypothetical protein BP677P1_00004 [Bifidobacterium phage BP677P1]WAX08553.1 hypothetical protein BP677P2_00004 [Bifidobacterium phage BP677P2]WAX08638.1 hypothetical protein BP677P3_00043 [Bifidobacterium phage BP677P3]WAX08684.1 hypothetical protein BP677P4_00043 [Bifidobacterium phage BP677P4]WAX08730.1 hypothetical protein BP677P8_00043 [Bifidobacterium phage BP677P8]